MACPIRCPVCGAVAFKTALENVETTACSQCNWAIVLFKVTLPAVHESIVIETTIGQGADE